MSKIQIQCENCKILFNKEIGEYNRKIKLNSKFYCSQSCAGKQSTNHLKPYLGIIHPNFKRVKDEFSPFREYLRRVRRRIRLRGSDVNMICEITLADLMTQWNKQDGKCVYTGVSMTHPSCLARQNTDFLTCGSLDRIDSSIGYVNGNIQFVSVAANLAKNKMSHEQMLEFCEIIRQNH